MQNKVKADAKIDLSFKITIELTEQEAQAIVNVFGYSPEAYLKVFYKELGTSYLKPHEAGVYSLHNNLAPELKSALYKIESTRNHIKNQPK